MTTLANRYWAWERTLEEYQGRQKEIDRIIRDNGGRTSGVAQALKKMFGISGHSLTMPDPGKKNGFRIVGFIKFETRGVVVERYPEDTPSGEREEVHFTWTDVAKAMIDHAKGEKAEAEAFENRPSKSQAQGRNDKNMKQEEKIMTTLANRTEAKALTLADYEARIHLYKEQIGVGYIGIGKTLNEAKAAQVVPHGQWESWVTQTTGLTPRQAQRCMQAATEIRDGSALAQLEMSKAILLLGSGLDEETREEIAGKAAEEGATVKALREEIRKAKEAQAAADAENAETVKALKLQVVRESGAAAEIREALKKAQAERDDVKRQLEATIGAYQKRMDEETGNAYRRGLQDKAAGMEHDIRKEFQGKIDFLNSQKQQAEERVKSLQTELAATRNEGSTRWDEGYRAAQNEITGLKNEANKQRQYAEELRRNQDDLLAAAEEAEQRAANAEAELEALKACGPEGKEPAWKTIKTATDRFLTDCEMLPIWDGPGILRGEQQVEPCLERLEMWLRVMRETLAGCIPSEGAVE